MKKRLSLLLAFVLCLGLMPCAYATNSPFVDILPDFWAYDSILETYNDGVMMGTGTDENGNKVFSPSGKLNMAQFVTVLTRAFYNDDVVNSTREGAWPNQNYDAADKHNLFTGLTRWGGDIEVTREVMAQMMYNVMVDKGVILPNDSEIQMTISKIPDFAAVDSSYGTAVAVCYYLDLLSGVNEQGTFAPKGLINRAQTSVIYVRLKKAISTLGTDVPGTPGTTNPGTTDPGTTQNPGTTTPDTPQNPGETQNPTEATLTNGMPVTVDNVLALIEEYKNGTREPGEKAKEAGFTSYTNGSTYDPYDPKYRIVLPDGPINGIECSKFAFAFSDDIFGDAPYREVTDPWQVRPGDLIHWESHWAIARKSAYSSKLWDCPCTLTVGGGKAGSIGWGNVDQTLDFNENLVAIYTRYPD